MQVARSGRPRGKADSQDAAADDFRCPTHGSLGTVRAIDPWSVPLLKTGDESRDEFREARGV